MAGFVKVGTTADFPPDQGKMVEAGGKKIALFNLNGTYYAIDDTCTHRGGPLSDGELSGTEVTCPWHGAAFDLTTGNVLRPPAMKGVGRYTVRVSGQNVEIEI